jgi:hypothetical protein
MDIIQRDEAHPPEGQEIPEDPIHTLLNGTILYAAASCEYGLLCT